MSQPPPKPAKLKLRRRAAPSTQEPLTEAPTPLSRPSTKSQPKNPARKDSQPPNVPKTHKSAHSNEPGDISFEQLAEMFGDDSTCWLQGATIINSPFRLNANTA